MLCSGERILGDAWDLRKQKNRALWLETLLKKKVGGRGALKTFPWGHLASRAAEVSRHRVKVRTETNLQSVWSRGQWCPWMRQSLPSRLGASPETGPLRSAGRTPGNSLGLTA